MHARIYTHVYTHTRAPMPPSAGPSNPCMSAISCFTFPARLKISGTSCLHSPPHNPRGTPQPPASALMRAGTRTCLSRLHASLCTTHRRRSSKQRTERGKEGGRKRERKRRKSSYSSTNNNLPQLQSLACFFSHFCSNSKLPRGKSDSKLRSNTPLLKINVFLKQSIDINMDAVFSTCI